MISMKNFSLKYLLALICGICVLPNYTWGAPPFELDLESLNDTNEEHSKTQPQNAVHHDDEHTVKKSPSKEVDTSDLQINSIGPVTPIEEKSLVNENIAVPYEDNSHVLDMAQYWESLALAQSKRKEGKYDEAKLICITLLEEATPDEINQLALIQLAYNLDDLHEYQKANQVLAQYIITYNKAENIPEAYLRQGQILKKLGSVELAIGKFYSAMSSALSMNEKAEDKHQKVAMLAQTEIADTYYYSGDFDNAIRSYNLILKAPDKHLDVAFIEFKLLRAKMQISDSINTLNAVENYVNRYPDSKFIPEAQFIKAVQLEKLDRDSEMMQTVLQLLRIKPDTFEAEENLLIPWQQKAGNLLANSLFKKGDYQAARSAYKELRKMDSDPNWYIPATYQFAQCSERLQLQREAVDSYLEIISIGHGIVEDEKSLQVKSLIEMAEFRVDQLTWLKDAREKGRAILDPSANPGKSQAIDEDKNLKWLGAVYEKMDSKTAAKILAQLGADDTSGILKQMEPTRQGVILREIGKLGKKEKSMAAAVAVSLGLPKELAGIDI